MRATSRFVIVMCATWFAITAQAGTITIAQDGSGAFKTVQAAIDSIPEMNSEPQTLLIKPGVYKERIILPKGKNQITLRGDDKDPRKTVLTWNRFSGMDDHDAPGKKVGTSGSESVLIAGDDFAAENITFENFAGEVGQAVAVRTMGDRQVFRNCRFLGWQDTLYVRNGRQYFAGCYIEGRTDFIFGDATAVFDKCEIYTKKGSYITAASTKPQTAYGLVFLDCKITGDGAKTYLGRPWKEGSATAFIRCELGEHIRPEGWSEWRGNENHKTARYSEYKNTGPGAGTSARIAWSKQLTDEEASRYTVQGILAGADGWNPASK